ncbi:MAG: 2-oxoacid:acceptor oxidoreductase family protein [Candidatus Aenigmarchaeota archaeon]|nr:2-oxoacid:acceptor oxidoreductase family protein [Candidatus Aenigmarchaeota archaeon]
MTTFKIYGRGADRVDRTRRVLGRACFLSGMDVVDFIFRSPEPNGYNIAYVKADKTVTSRSPEQCDYLLLMDEKVSARAFDGLKDGSVVIAKEKVQVKSVRAKSHAVGSSDGMSVLGGLTKLFSRVSIKSMKSAIEEELGDDKALQAAFEAGYREVK